VQYLRGKSLAPAVRGQYRLAPDLLVEFCPLVVFAEAAAGDDGAFFHAPCVRTLVTTRGHLGRLLAYLDRRRGPALRLAARLLRGPLAVDAVDAFVARRVPRADRQCFLEDYFTGALQVWRYDN
jgi:hypothetical protein